MYGDIGFDVKDGRFFTTVYSLGSGLFLGSWGQSTADKLHIGEYRGLSHLAMCVRPSVFRQCTYCHCYQFCPQCSVSVVPVVTHLACRVCSIFHVVCCCHPFGLSLNIHVVYCAYHSANHVVEWCSMSSSVVCVPAVGVNVV